MAIKIYRWNIQNVTGYEPKTTFWEDFRIADGFGINAVRDTYKRAFKEWKSDHVYLTELVMVLNHSIWLHWELGNMGLSKLYDELWRKAHSYAVNHLDGDELRYYLDTTD